MRDQGKPFHPSDKDILNETLRSLQDLIREVDEVAAPEPAARVPEVEPQPAVEPPEPEPAPAEANAPYAGHPSPEDEPMIEWYSSLTDPAATRRQEATASPVENEMDDVPLLQDIAVLPGRPRRSQTTGPTQQDLLAPVPEHRFEPVVIAEVTDKTIGFLEEKLSDASGQPLDHETRVHLRQQIYAVLQEWVTATERRLHSNKK
jgi:hypothetical protein